MTALAVTLAEWAHGLRPGPADLDLAGRSLRDTVAVALAARDHPVTRLAAQLPECARWAVAAHVLDFDDLHMESTTHISAVCVPTALATGGGARAYLAAASFTDQAVRRPAARRLIDRTEVKLDPGGSWLLDGELQATVHTSAGEVRQITQRYPPGSPARPPESSQLQAKLAGCVTGLETDPASWTWDNAAQVLRLVLSDAGGRAGPWTS